MAHCFFPETASLISTFTGPVEGCRHARGIEPAQPPARTVAFSMYAYLMGLTQSWLFYPELATLETSLEFFVADFVRLLRTGQ